MRLEMPFNDARTRGGRRNRKAIMDLDTGKTVGFISGGHGSGGDNVAPYWIEMFGGKYVGGFKSWDECNAFAKGVEAVLSHIAAVGSDEELADAQTGAA